MQSGLKLLQMLRLTPRKHCTCRQNHSKSLLLGLRSHHWLHWVGWTFENTAPVDKSDKATLENTAPVDKTEKATLENTAPVDKSEEATLENIAPVDKSEAATLENTAPIDKSETATLENTARQIRENNPRKHCTCRQIRSLKLWKHCTCQRLREGEFRKHCTCRQIWGSDTWKHSTCRQINGNHCCCAFEITADCAQFWLASLCSKTPHSFAETSKSLLRVLSSDLRIFPSRLLHCFGRAFEVNIHCAQFWPTFLFLRNHWTASNLTLRDLTGAVRRHMRI